MDKGVTVSDKGASIINTFSGGRKTKRHRPNRGLETGQNLG